MPGESLSPVSPPASRPAELPPLPRELLRLLGLKNANIPRRSSGKTAIRHLYCGEQKAKKRDCEFEDREGPLEGQAQAGKEMKPGVLPGQTIKRHCASAGKHKGVLSISFFWFPVAKPLFIQAEGERRV